MTVLLPDWPLGSHKYNTELDTSMLFVFASYGLVLEAANL